MSWIDLVAQRRPQPPQGVTPPENAKDWFRIENSADEPDATDVLIYSSIGGWFGMWADEFVDELKAVTTSKINLRLNSPGGSVFDGIAIANAIRSHPATVTVYVDSLAASIASVIAMSGDRLVMMPQSQIMVHNASGACYGDSTEMVKMAEMLDKQSRNIAEAYAQHTGGSLAEWQQYMADETWFTADEALAAGLADEVMPMKAPKKEAPLAPAEAHMSKSWDLSMYRYAGREQAPAPVAAKQPFAAGGLVVAAGIANGITAAQMTPPLADGEFVLSASAVAQMSRDDLLALIRQEIKDAFPPPKEDEEEEGPDETEEADNAAEADPQDVADVVPMPPEGMRPGETNPPAEHPVDTGLGDVDSTVESTETYDEADPWNQVVGSFVSPLTSPPSADDVFAQLKGAW